ncbi:integral membrane protein [Metarhizium rileyi]|uniref:Integral membrane protein n=1 Tax=Metarhizium rileyi (strain RCEF 4871) TaxID=1649241 RepID=A0A166Y265_METRR|nr:integral membrane protein [Metarhizium rileyi RCEF 4871]
MASDRFLPPPPGIDLTQDKGPLIIAVSVTTWVLALTMVLCRILGRRMRGLRLWLDDWFIIAALPPSSGHVLAIAAYVRRGLGKHVWSAKPDGVYAWALGLFVAEICYTLTLVAVKLSILSFYWRSFSVRDSVKLPIFMLAFIVCIWGIAVLLVTSLQCMPTRAVWERFDPVSPTSPYDYSCPVDPSKFFYGNAVPTIVTDFVMLALPVPYIWRLQLPHMQKFGLACVFLVGVFVTIISIVRLYYLLLLDLNDPDITWNFVPVGVWSIVEGNIAVVCACLPFLKPAMNKS